MQSVHFFKVETLNKVTVVPGSWLTRRSHPGQVILMLKIGYLLLEKLIWSLVVLDINNSTLDLKVTPKQVKTCFQTGLVVYDES